MSAYQNTINLNVDSDVEEYEHFLNNPDYTGRKHEPTLILEAVSSQDLRLWHSYFGLHGSLNDINVLDQSDVFQEITEGTASVVHYNIGGKTYDMGYYLADGIYPSYATLIKTISNPVLAKEKLFAQKQEATRKDVERAFGALQARFNIVKLPAKSWGITDLNMIMKACIILHNMIVEDERGIDGLDMVYEQSLAEMSLSDRASRRATSKDVTRGSFSEFVTRYGEVTSRINHAKLVKSLVNNLWSMAGNNE
ncbi:hypothetical protein PHYBLDRAFT_168010 [Phycomyces blakesleeanus NRRL 1555(-)]|uniref:DDE Tnp4 domain-containing protein n=1 Tax=Phycomyces blakesleeanus (strain ATCC 8743b / DSM 1359 / FGSC 10004 / NBRC 33097 / NRRL 1555) TaxID=763407 RepID=A0A162NIR2_PHYB8|nr:hypothetical protein PHYBLDRAFT_168010 [Phycomyces blakesleeanus NRRL 1555(-)]OAD74608.1 hypothetical protein PHYBLDRAFT_168010 [Phycomyces blakesleeanus NRRL 1555(-)]|eukprot:XP_018292648.1 hypothetical protein PHYBLDRAFT_168010 [Phycomyces blakesleeanus NRRL 1555(-)]